MDAEGRVTRRERDVKMRDQDDSPVAERWGDANDSKEEGEIERSKESSKHRSKDRSKSSGRREEKDHRSKDLERSSAGESLKERKVESSKEPRKADRDEREKDKREKDADRDKYRDKDRDRRDRVKEKDREREKDRVLESGKDKSKEKDRDREKEKDRVKDRKRERERESYKERETEKDRGKDPTEREKGKERERETDQDGERERGRSSRRQRDENHDRGKDDKLRLENEHTHDKSISLSLLGSSEDEDGMTIPNPEGRRTGPATSQLEERIMKMKEERLQKKPESASEILSWVNRSRKIEEKRNFEKEKALQLSKIFEEQDNIKEEESDDEQLSLHANRNLGGAKILHGLDKVLEGGAVVLTLKDQSILADGDVNQEVDMLENAEIGEQKRRDDAYKASKKKTGIHSDKFDDEPNTEKKMLPQYDEPDTDEGITLDASGRFTGDAEKKLEELRKRLQGVPSSNRIENLNASGKLLSDYYTQEEMLQFKKPKKKKSMRKKEKLDLEALEAEAISSGLGAEDLGSRMDGKRQALREEKERVEAQTRSNAYKAAYAKAEEASKALKIDPSRAATIEEDETLAIGDDDEDLRKSLERARKLALKKQEEAMPSFPAVIAQLASSAPTESETNNQNSSSVESQENKLVFTEMEEFVWGLQLNEEAQKTDGEDVFMEDDDAPNSPDNKNQLDEDMAEVKETKEEETFRIEKEEDVVPDDTIHESAVGKGLAGALKLLKDRGSLKQTVEWGGRNTDKKKSKLVGIHENEGKQKEIHIERTDEYGRILTPKEAFRLLSHKFHGKEPGKMKQEKKMRQYQDELKVKQMRNADTPSQSVEKMREVQAQLKTPYLVLSGHVKPGQTSDPRSGFATVEKDFPGGLTPMLGDKKVEHFLGLKRKSEPGNSASQKKSRN